MKSLEVKKLYYTISEVSKICGLEQYVLRYWETEFDQLSPTKNRVGNRIYTNSDVKLILEIKKLLREQRYTIEGAKKVLQDWKKEESELSQNLNIEKDYNESFKQDLLEIKKFLEKLLVKLSV